MDYSAAYGRIVSGTKKYFEESGLAKGVIGLSGGIDSSLTAQIAVDALGKGNVTGLLMPEDAAACGKNIADAKEWAEKLGIGYYIQPIDKFLQLFNSLEWKQSKIAEMNTKARARMVLLYNFANAHNALVVGTSNRSEILLGYFTKHGDGATDVCPLGNVYKTDVFGLARFKKLPEKIINKVPSADLFEGQTDEQELGAPYEKIDPILRALFDEGKSEAELKKKFDAALVEKLLARVKASGHKRSPAFIVEV